MREQNLLNARQPANGHRRVLWPVVSCRPAVEKSADKTWKPTQLTFQSLDKPHFPTEKHKSCLVSYISFLCFQSARNSCKLTNKILNFMFVNSCFLTVFSFVFKVRKLICLFVLSESCRTSKSYDFQLIIQVKLSFFFLFVGIKNH